MVNVLALWAKGRTAIIGNKKTIGLRYWNPIAFCLVISVRLTRHFKPIFLAMAAGMASLLR